MHWTQVLYMIDVCSSTTRVTESCGPSFYNLQSKSSLEVEGTQVVGVAGLLLRLRFQSGTPDVTTPGHRNGDRSRRVGRGENPLNQLKNILGPPIFGCYCKTRGVG